jgi:hypothetical protein
METVTLRIDLGRTKEFAGIHHTPRSGSTAWRISFFEDYTSYHIRREPYHVRLVREAQ